MGLDVSHLQLTLTPKDKYNFFELEDWEEECNVPIKHYAKYITTIDDLDFDKTLAIVKSEAEYEQLKQTEWFGSGEYLKIFIEEQNPNVKEQIRRFIVNQKLATLETVQLQTSCDGIEYHTISFGEPIKVQGMYYVDDAGYQSTGFNKKFYDTFKKRMLWGKKEDFELAYDCVEGDLEQERLIDNWSHKLKTNFKENFLDKFEFGKSLLCVSY